MANVNNTDPGCVSDAESAMQDAHVRAQQHQAQGRGYEHPGANTHPLVPTESGPHPEQAS